MSTPFMRLRILKPALLSKRGNMVPALRSNARVAARPGHQIETSLECLVWIKPSCPTKSAKRLFALTCRASTSSKRTEPKTWMAAQRQAQATRVLQTATARP